jgi:hypothetical protein
MKHALLIMNGLILLSCITIAGAFADQVKPIGSIKVKSDDETGFVDIARVPLDSAVKAALQAVPGKALKAELKNVDGSLVYEVEVINTKKRITDVALDAGNEKILKIEADRKDNGSIVW